MNRIILIGNGFDIAHGMDTRYKDFINDLWATIIEEIKIPNRDTDYNNFGINIKNCPCAISGKNYIMLKESIKSSKTVIEFENKFLGKITEVLYNQDDKESNKGKKEINWVDIEMEYYDSLKQIIIPHYQSKSDPENNFKYESVIYLNNDFDKIKEHLIVYLQKIISQNNIKSKENIENKIYSAFDWNDFSEELKNKKVRYQEIKTTNENINTQVKNYLFLNFNYTSIDTYYSTKKSIEIKTIHIHGDLTDLEKNPIIFGYGDEMEENYQTIENSNENDYLENIKSIKYFETNNYKELLGFINKGEYQVFLFGHSCGVSDRVLLNTLFEHKNCVSIKPFYYKIKETDKKGNETLKDNYSDIIRNISRHFNDKAVMRDKIVPKVHCKPLLD